MPNRNTETERRKRKKEWLYHFARQRRNMVTLRLKNFATFPVRREKLHSQAGVSVLCSFFCSFKRVELLTRLGCVQGLPGGTSGEEPTCQWRRHRRLGSIPRSGVSPGRGHGNPLQYSCRENPMPEEPGRLQSLGSQSRT